MADARIADYLAKWALDMDGAPFETPGSCLCFVRRGETRAVLKLHKPHADEERSAAALRALNGPCVRVLEADADAALIERCDPGTALSALVADGKDGKATSILCDCIADFRSPVNITSGWPRLEDWAQAFARIRDTHHTALTTDLIDRAEAEFFDLCATATDIRLLHGDLHHDNVLWDTARGWCVIDPKGTIGDRGYEVATALHNPTGHEAFYTDPAEMRRRIATFARRLNLDPQRILRWCFAQSTLSAAWHLRDESPDAEITAAVRTARAAEKLLTSA